jgi:hypothetical protein
MLKEAHAFLLSSYWAPSRLCPSFYHLPNLSMSLSSLCVSRYSLHMQLMGEGVEPKKTTTNSMGPFQCVDIKVVGNSKGGGSGNKLLLECCFGPW